MPQIRCPNCGLTINLENRKDTDITMITSAVRHNASTFTDLLRMTGLPRKTLSMRLKELCQTGVLDKADGMYVLSGSSVSERRLVNPLARFSGAVHDKRMRGFIMLGLLLIGLPSVSYVLAMLVSMPVTPAAPSGPQLLGNFTMAVNANGLSDLWSWQVPISYDSSKLKVLGVECGEFLQTKDPYFTWANVTTDMLLVGATLRNGDPGVSGSGNLATIVFGYYVESYTQPVIVQGVFQTVLYDSQLNNIPASESTLELRVLP